MRVFKPKTPQRPKKTLGQNSDQVPDLIVLSNTQVHGKTESRLEKPLEKTALIYLYEMLTCMVATFTRDFGCVWTIGQNYKF